ncbi:MAG: hypothetical protein OHK0017_09210 [Patescibacteria group bacterium]
MPNLTLTKRFLTLGLIGIAFVCSILFLFPNNALLTVALIILSVLVIKINFQLKDLFIFFLAILIGTTGDILSTSAGAWQFTFPVFLNIPLWIPVSWGCNMLIIYKLADCLTEIYQSYQIRKEKGN